MNVEHHIDYLVRKTDKLEYELRQHRDYIDTVSSPLRKRIWWWFGGYNFRTVGRWYPEDSKRFKRWLKIAKLIHCT